MSDKPEPRVDEDGVPWCQEECPFYRGAMGNNATDRPLHCHGFNFGTWCKPAVRDMARELREARACIRRMHWHFRDTDRVYFAGETEHALAFDAAMKEVP